MTHPDTWTAPIVLTLPMTPDRSLAINRSHGRNWRGLSDKIKQQRWDAMNAARGQVDTDEAYRDPVAITVTIHWGKSMKAGQKRARIEQDRRLDWDSATALCKPMCDGALVDTGILADDRQIVAGTVYQTVDPTGDGFTTIEITAVESAREG